MRKLIVINGSGGVGKDTFCSYVHNYIKSTSISIIDFVKSIAYKIGWRFGKSEKDRKFLADLKLLIDDYNDGTYKIIKDEAECFLNYEEEKYIGIEVLFIHIRNTDVIKRLVTEFKDYDISTLLITNKNVVPIKTNSEDAGVFNYNYDYIICNDGSKEEFEQKAKEFVDTIKQ